MIAGIGIIPSTEFLRSSGISLTSHGFVNVDRHMRVLNAETREPIENVFAGGDIAMYPQMYVVLFVYLLVCLVYLSSSFLAQQCDRKLIWFQS